MTRDESQHAAELLELGDAFFELDRHWRIVRVNRRQEELSRKPAAETVGRTFGEVWPDLVTPESRYLREYRRCMEERVPVQFEEYFAPLDLWTAVTAYPVSGGGVAVFFRDVSAAKRAEEAAARSEAVLAQAGAMAHLGAWWIEVSDPADLGSSPLRWSDEVFRIFGYEPGEVPVSNELFFRHVHPDDRQRVTDAVARALAERRPYAVEHRIVRRDGGERLVLEHGEAHRDAAGRLVRIVGAVQDITARRLADEALREREQRLRALFEDIAVGIVEADEEDRFITVNGRFCRMLGYDDPAELLGRSLHDVTAPEDRALTRELNARGRAGLLRVFEYEKRYLRRDGSRLWVHVNVSVVRDADGRFARAVGTVEDIAERKAAEDEARSLAQFPRENPNPVLRAATDGRVLYLNEPARACLQAMGWRDGALLPEPLLVELRRVPERGTIRAHEVATSDGRAWSFTLSASAGEGHVNAYGLDITDRKRSEDELRRANERLREADRRKDEFLGMLSHELRNPLAPIRTALYVLDHADPAAPQARRAREVAARQVAHLTRLVDDLLDVTRVARGRIELRRAELELVALVRRTADDHRALLHERRLELALELPDAPVPVDGDETRLAQVIGNLLHNAAKFTPAGGRVTLSVAAVAGSAEIRVRDTGPGIAPDVLPTLFEPFTQAKQTLARSEGGLGLGLALVKALVSLHGGSVAARSVGPGTGTEFVVTLPLAAARAAAAAAPSSANSGAGARPRRVLVIDDNRDAAESLAELVGLLGHEADVAYDGVAGLAKAAEQQPDVVLCDIGLPGMDGYEVARRLRARSSEPRVRLVAVSGYAQPEDVARAVEAGFDAHVAKPPDPDELARLLG